MKRILFLMSVCTLLSLGMEACSHDEDSHAPHDEDVSEYMLMGSGTVRYYNEAINPGVLAEYVTTDDVHMEIYADTIVMVLAPSGHGYEKAHYRAIRLASDVDYYYYSSDVDYNQNPQRIYIRQIWIN